MADTSDETLLTLTADIVAAYVTNNRLPAQDVAPVIQQVHATLAGLGKPVEAPAEQQKPAVPVRSSIKPDHLVSLESGKKMKMLKRYLMTNYGMTPEDYRKKWGLPSDYPMVAPNYSESRKALAKAIGLGRKPRDADEAEGAEPELDIAEAPVDETPAEAAPAEKPAPKRRGKAAAKPAAVEEPAAEAEPAPAPKRRGRKPKGE
ncbi:MucR family transcriptional regulator [Sphingomonas jatrophae]|uniref:Transcriptional regulator, MucR family n=1 Tax=Sphingomonas jatrophae TaxID=1166337 RepID=A0A1I6LMH8_9SPHN|nr:MucR family transcriptional regulator [Sphingomonas jatrophae]SFS04619.1 transcriptional regulator, MucR family [Sphingomonas jatrophae]